MGMADQRLKKLQTLPAVSRSIILKRAQELRAKQKDKSIYRSFGKQVEARRQLELAWNEKQEDLFKTDHEKKQEISLVKERKRLNLLEELKVNSGPFTNSDEVDNFLNDSMINDKDKQKRMKKEIQFARDSSTTLPKVSPLFKIRITMSDKKQRDKTAK